MKRFKHYLQEALDKPYQMSSFTSRDGHVYEFYTDDGREGRITIDMEDDYSYELDGDVAVVVFEIDGTTTKTGKGDQFRIFATVAKAIDDFMKTRRDDVGKIHFSADKPMATAGSRVSLYRKFAQKLAKKYNLKLDTFDAGNVMEFDLIKESINEEAGFPVNKRFKHYLQEALDKPYPMKKSRRGDVHEYDFHVASGVIATVKIEYDREYGNADIQFEVGRTMKKRDSGGDQFRIFATVRAALEDFMKSNHPNELFFSGTKDSAQDSDSRLKLYKTLAKKIAKKYKYKLNTYSNSPGQVVFELTKESINEEWVTQNDWVGDMFKNPTPRELSEYMKTVNQLNIAGIVADGDIYLFDGMHDDGFEEIRKHKNGYPRKSFRWRAIIRGGKFASLGPSGGDPIDYYGVSKETREALFKDMAAVYTNKYMKSRMGTYDQAFGEVIRAFMRFSGMEEQEVFAELEQLKKKYKVK